MQKKGTVKRKEKDTMYKNKNFDYYYFFLVEAAGEAAAAEPASGQGGPTGRVQGRMRQLPRHPNQEQIGFSIV